MTALIRLIGIGSVIAYGLYKAMQSRTESTQKNLGRCTHASERKTVRTTKPA